MLDQSTGKGLGEADGTIVPSDIPNELFDARYKGAWSEDAKACPKFKCVECGKTVDPFKEAGRKCEYCRGIVCAKNGCAWFHEEQCPYHPKFLKIHVQKSPAAVSTKRFGFERRRRTG